MTHWSQAWPQVHYPETFAVPIHIHDVSAWGDDDEDFFPARAGDMNAKPGPGDVVSSAGDILSRDPCVALRAGRVWVTEEQAQEAERFGWRVRERTTSQGVRLCAVER